MSLLELKNCLQNYCLKLKKALIEKKYFYIIIINY